MPQALDYAADVISQTPEPTRITLSNGSLDVDVCLPNGADGAYCGSRFSWAGIVSQATYRGHTWFGDWRDEPCDADHHDAVTGTAGEFGAGDPPPIGYRDAEPGDLFIKIGVGLLRRRDNRPYLFAKAYDIVESPEWEIVSDASSIEMRQRLRLGSYGYDYVYRLEIEPDAPAFVVRHRLTNTGETKFRQTHYAHNFFVFDQQPVGPGCEVLLPFTAHAKVDRLSPVAVFGDRIDFTGGVGPGGAVFGALTGFDDTPASNGFVVRNRKAGIGVAVSGDRPVANFHLFATPRTICPEPFVDIRLAPGAAFDWSHRYELLVDEKTPFAG